jgi:hypothetical protein
VQSRESYRGSESLATKRERGEGGRASPSSKRDRERAERVLNAKEQGTSTERRGRESERCAFNGERERKFV